MKNKLYEINPQKTALLVIDMQNDFTEEGAILEIKNIRKGFPKLKKFIDDCRDTGITIIYTRHTFRPERNPIEALLFPKLAGNGLRKNTHGWEINDYLKPRVKDVIIDKTRYDAFYKTDLDKILKEQGITNVIITGTMTEVCCDGTAGSAMFRDYFVFMPSDLNFTSDKNKNKYALKTVSHNFGWVLSAKNLWKQIKF